MSLPPASFGGFAHSGGWTTQQQDAPMAPTPTPGLVSDAVRALNAATVGATADDRGRLRSGTRARHLTKADHALV